MAMQGRISLAWALGAWAAAALAVVSGATFSACGTEDVEDVTPDGALDGLVDLGSETSEAGADGGDGGVDAPADAPTDAADGVVTDGEVADAADAPPKTCLPTTTMDAYFSLPGDGKKCLVAQYTVPVAGLASLTWGHHGGPLQFDTSSGPTLVRWDVPGATTGALTAKKTPLTVSGVPSGAFWGAQAVDLPFFGWTAFAYSTSGAGFPGELVLVDVGGAFTRYKVNGLFSAGSIGLSSTSGGRLLYTGLSGLSTTASTTNEGGLWAADSCGSAATAPRLLPEGDSSCKAPFKVTTWAGGSSGPVTVDPAENFFAILSKFGGKQELRGFERSTVARSAGTTAGTTTFSIDGYTTELVADGASVYYQSNDASTYTALDVTAQDYTVDSGAKTVKPSGAARTFLKLKTAGTPVALIVDGSRRLWALVDVPGTGEGGVATSAMAFVIQ